MQTPSISAAASSSRQTSVASTPAQSRHSRSRSRAPGLADQICQILHAELRRGRDLRCYSSSSSGGSSDSQSSPQSDCGQSSGRHCRHVVLVIRSAALLVGTRVAHTPTVAVIALALARTRLNVMRVLMTALGLVAHRSSSVHVRSRNLRVPSWWPLRRPWGQSRPPRFPHPSFPCFLLCCR